MTCQLCHPTTSDLLRQLMAEQGLPVEFGAFTDYGTMVGVGLHRDENSVFLRLSRSFGENNSGADVELSITTNYCPICGRNLKDSK